ncbi:MAG: DUF2497 domain-containing protein [Pseudomonadota bacterium]|nr:DUF2497 domain-containing protein [Pseudomonadota bacterium]
MAEDTQKQEESMEDILASIRETVEEEVGKADDDESSASATNSDEDIANELLSEELTGEEDQNASSDDDAKEEAEALAALSNIEESSDEATPAEESSSEDDVLELTDVVEQGDKAAGDDMIDVNKFAESGEITEASKEDVAASRKSYGASADDADDMDVDIDGIMSELESEGEIPSAENNLPSEDDAASFIAQNNVDEDEAQATIQPQGEADDMLASSDDAEQSEQPAAEAPAEPQEQAAPATEAVAKAAAEEVAKKVFLPTTPSAKGLQVSFPAEVLAEALRPLVTDWINQNLGDIVERLVKEEISKLVDK